MSQMSYVLAYEPPSPEVSAACLLSKLNFYTDAADVAADLQNGVPGIAVIDTRSAEHYARGHVPGAVSFPHKNMTAESTRDLSKDVVYVTYCDGIGCNGSTQGAYKLAKLGFRVKEMIGGLDFWIRDQHPVATGEARGNYPANLAPEDCGCA
ncbi:rhodanese-like domain-containing protein [Rahnella sp. PCH160]|uniref:rhodanese-like domain-containing protein n=1 Tax=Rahnella sp. PCH160 TaxID=3447928 RepID=UPI0039FB9A1E